MKRGWILILLVSIGLNLGLGWKIFRDRRGAESGAASQRGRGEGWMRTAPGDSAAWEAKFHRRLGRVAKRLDLRPEQMIVFEKAHVAAARAMHREHARVGEARERLFRLATGGDVDPVAVRQALADMRREQARLDSLASEYLLGELEVLDPAQRSLYLRLLPLERGGAGRDHWPGRNRRGRRQPEEHRQ